MLETSNVRIDAYGGSFENRLRLVTELIQAIRAHCGPGFILGAKMAGDDGDPGGIRIDEPIRIGRHLAFTGGGDYFCLAQGSHHRSLEMHIPDDHDPRQLYLPLTGPSRWGCRTCRSQRWAASPIPPRPTRCWRAAKPIWW